MQLGRKQNNSDLFESLRSEVEAAPAPQQYQQQHQAPAQNSYSAPAEPAFPMESVHVQIEEKITMVANRDGGLESMEVKGDLMLRVSDPSRAKISLALRHLEDPNIQFKTHPNVNKVLFNTEKTIAFRDSTKEFPLNTPTGVLRWRFLSKDESSIPLSSKPADISHDCVISLMDQVAIETVANFNFKFGPNSQLLALSCW